MNDVVCVFEPFDKPSQVLIDALLKVQVGDEPFFRVRIKPYPTYSNEHLLDFFHGRRDVETGNYLEKPIQPNNRALRILRETDHDVENKDDRPKWDHLGIVFPTKYGKIPGFIKYITRVDDNEKQLRNPKYWQERFDNKILVLLHNPEDGGKLPSKEAINRYNRVWVVHENVMRNITQKCPKCTQQMIYTNHLYCKECNFWNRWDYPVPKKYPKCQKCGGDYIKVFDPHKLQCTNPECHKTKSHARVKFIGPLMSSNLKEVDFIGEYSKAMTVRKGSA